ncbi:MAG: hypothetical protein M0D55_19835 [Elusimicrobiota bacterium]|nr:MAG: hypothetical protein M0D55_19835 [Elusimicrobiota bacterium]
MRLALLLIGLAVPSSALDIAREDFGVLGWTDACSVAIERYAYPYLGEAMQAEPITSRLGTLTIELKTPVTVTRWVFEADGVNTYDPHAIETAKRKLRKAGFDRPGFYELIRDSETVVSPGSAEVILSTASLDARPDFWPDTREWRWARAYYNPIGTCALLVYERIGEPERYKMLLTRYYNPAARSDRGRAHVVNGRLLFNKGDLASAFAETEIGARLAPEVGGVRYQYAAMLAMTGHPDRAMKELLAAIKREPGLRKRALDDLDFETLHDRQDFQELIQLKPRPGPPIPP